MPQHRNPLQVYYSAPTMHHRCMSGIVERWPYLPAALVVVILSFLVVRNYGSLETHHAVIASGVTSGVPWQLEASNPDGRFCLVMSGGDAAEFGASCGFGPAASIYSSATVSKFASDRVVIFGPAPSAATQVRLGPALATPQCHAAASAAVVRQPLGGALPSWAPSGKWFVVSASRPLCAWNITFLDSSGKSVKDHLFS
jgi:hypothetical protein